MGFSKLSAVATNCGMDAELAKKLQSVADGVIRDTDSARVILSDSREALDLQDERLGRMRELLFRAEQAFLRGWTPIA
jgi:hypothetical protein